MRWVVCVALFCSAFILGVWGWSAGPDEWYVSVLGYIGALGAVFLAFQALDHAKAQSDPPRRKSDYTSKRIDLTGWSAGPGKLPPNDPPDDGGQSGPDGSLGVPLSPSPTGRGGGERKVYDI